VFVHAAMWLQTLSCRNEIHGDELNELVVHESQRMDKEIMALDGDGSGQTFLFRYTKDGLSCRLTLGSQWNLDVDMDALSTLDLQLLDRKLTTQFRLAYQCTVDEVQTALNTGETQSEGDRTASSDDTDECCDAYWLEDGCLVVPALSCPS